MAVTSNAIDFRWTTRRGVALRVRPIRPNDELALARFEMNVSIDSIYRRYMEIVPRAERLSHRFLAGRCNVEPDRELALVAIVDDGPQAGDIVALGQLVREAEGSAEFALLVADAYQAQGIGTRLLGALMEDARERNVALVEGYIASTNGPMLQICRKAGFRLSTDSSARLIVARRSPL
jgi:acetyltransferase